MNKHVVLYLFVLLCKNVVLQNISNFINYSIIIAKKNNLAFIFVVGVVLSEVIFTLDQCLCADLVREHSNIKDFCLINIFFEYCFLCWQKISIVENSFDSANDNIQKLKL